MEKLKGPFKDIIPRFQQYKKSLGYEYNNINNYNNLDRQLFNSGIKDLKNTKKIFDVLVTNTKDYKKEMNYYCLKELYSFMNILGYKNLYIEELYFKKDPKAKSVILTKNEILELFNKIDALSKIKSNVVYPVFFRLIYSCGLRPSEAINLKINDISLENETIRISKSKHNKTRIIPLSSSMLEIIKQYLSKVENNTYLFEINRKQLNLKTVNKFFNNITKEMRIYDLRHIFAIHTLNKLFDGDVKSSEALYPLSIYMGHANVKSTEYYLKFTKEYYKDVIQKIDKYYKKTISKKGGKDATNV